MNYAEISESVEKLKRKYGESDPFRLCRDMGIKLLFQAMGTHPDAIKGFFLESKRIRTITINSDLPMVIQRIIAAHELCHATNHRSSGIHPFHEVALFYQMSVLEKDANLFAAAAALCVSIELLDFKFRVMKWKGYKLIEPPINARSNFPRDMEVPDESEICE